MLSYKIHICSVAYAFCSVQVCSPETPRAKEFNTRTGVSSKRACESMESWPPGFQPSEPGARGWGARRSAGRAWGGAGARVGAAPGGPRGRGLGQAALPTAPRGGGGPGPAAEAPAPGHASAVVSRRRRASVAGARPAPRAPAGCSDLGLPRSPLTSR